MDREPKLIDVATPARPRGVVLVLHGGAGRPDHPMVSPTQLSVIRLIPVAHRVGRIGRGELAVFRLLNSSRGWNVNHTPVDDTRWGLAQIADRYGEALPTCLIGHSLGGRAALLSAGRPGVRSVVALAPWVDPSDAPAGLSGEQILIVHGTADRIASPARSAQLARRLAADARVGYVSVEGGTHSMLRHHRRFDGLAAAFAATTLLGAPAAGALARVQAGESWVTV